MKRTYHVIASTFEPQELFYSGIEYTNGAEIGYALPYNARDKVKVHAIRSHDTGRTLFNPQQIDIGPWNWTDPWWAFGGHVMAAYMKELGIKADNGRIPSNMAGIDLTWGAARVLGLPDEYKGIVDVTMSWVSE